MHSRLNVALVGAGFMGKSHSLAWHNASKVTNLECMPVPKVIVGSTVASASAAAAQYGWEESTDRWQDVIAREDIHVIDIVTPDYLHAEIAIAALAAGKHVLCEKPLATTVDEAIAMNDAAIAAEASNVFAMVGYTYRRVPAIGLAREIIASGKIGEVLHAKFSYLQDWLSDPLAPATWRMSKEATGAGALGDIGSHIIDLSMFLTGRKITAVSGETQTVFSTRPSASDQSRKVEVSVDDRASFTAKHEGAFVATFQASRVATGKKNALEFEIFGTEGAIRFNLEELNVLEYFDAREQPSLRGYTRILVTEPGHPYLENWWPAGHLVGWENSFTNQSIDFVRSIESGIAPHPSFADALFVQRVVSAVIDSSEHSSAFTTIN